jgi:hypothetical protein
MTHNAERYKFHCPQCNETTGGLQKNTAEWFVREHKQEPGKSRHTPRVIKE